MALTVTTDLVQVAEANATADTDANWLDIGGGGGAAEEVDFFIQGAGGSETCYSRAVNTASERGFWYDLGAGNELDFSASGANENELIYIWIQAYAPGLQEALATGGLAIRIGDALTSWNEYFVSGNDFPSEGDEFFKMYVIDPSLDESTNDGGTAGTNPANLASIRYIGATLDNTASSKGQTLGIDQIMVGRGEIRATGTVTTAGAGFQEIADADWGTLANRYGIIQQKDGITYVQGKIIIGDDSGTLATTFSSENETLVWRTPWYYDGVASERSKSVPDEDEDGLGYWGLDIVGNATGATAVTFGTQVGSTEFGRSGPSFRVADQPNINDVTFGDRQEWKMTVDANVDDFDIFSATFSDCLDADDDTIFDFSNLDVNDKLYSVTFNGCGRIDPGAGEWRNCFFIDNASTLGQLLWLPGTTDVEDSQFISYGAAAIYEPDSNAGAGDTWTGLTFDLTGTDELNYDDTEAQTITIVDGTAAASLTSNDASGATTFTGAVTVTIEVVDLNDQPVRDAAVGVFESPGGTQVMNEYTPTNGIATESYTGTTPQDVLVRIRKSRTQDNFDLQTEIPATALWSLNETSSVMADTIGSNDGTVTLGSGTRGATALTALGDACMEFNLSSVIVTDVAGIQNIFDGGGSCAMAFRRDATGETSTSNLFRKGNATAGWMLNVQPEVANNQFNIRFRQEFSTTQGTWRTENDPFARGEVVAIVVTYDADSTSNDPTFYIASESVPFAIYTVANGGLNRVDTPVGTRSSDASHNLAIGSNTSGGAARFEGAIDDPGIYATALTAAQAEQIVRYMIGKAVSYFPISVPQSIESTGLTAKFALTEDTIAI